MVRVNTFLTATSLLALSAVSLADDRKCYYPDHSESLTDVPCGNGTNVACCGAGDICLSTGLCIAIQQQPYSVSRKSCTDQNWGSDCPNYCLQEASFNSSWVSIVLYTFLNKESNYCCNNIVDSDGSAVCLNNLNTFTMPDASIVPNTNLLAGYVEVNSSSTTTNSTASTCNATTSASSMSSNSTATTVDGSNSSSSSNHDAAIGAGVGIPLGLIALASIGWALWERRRLHRVSAAHEAAIAAATTQSSQKQEAYTYNNGNNNNQSPQPPFSSQTQYTPPANSQYGGGYPHSNAASANAYQNSTVPNSRTGFSEMGSTGPVELDNTRMT